MVLLYDLIPVDSVEQLAASKEIYVLIEIAEHGPSCLASQHDNPEFEPSKVSQHLKILFQYVEFRHMAVFVFLIYHVCNTSPNMN